MLHESIMVYRKRALLLQLTYVLPRGRLGMCYTNADNCIHEPIKLNWLVNAIIGTPREQIMRF